MSSPPSSSESSSPPGVVSFSTSPPPSPVTTSDDCSSSPEFSTPQPSTSAAAAPHLIPSGQGVANLLPSLPSSSGASPISTEELYIYPFDWTPQCPSSSFFDRFLYRGVDPKVSTFTTSPPTDLCSDALSTAVYYYGTCVYIEAQLVDNFLLPLFHDSHPNLLAFAYIVYLLNIPLLHFPLISSGLSHYSLSPVSFCRAEFPSSTDHSFFYFAKRNFTSKLSKAYKQRSSYEFTPPTPYYRYIDFLLPELNITFPFGSGLSKVYTAATHLHPPFNDSAHFSPSHFSPHRLRFEHSTPRRALSAEREPVDRSPLTIPPKRRLADSFPVDINAPTNMADAEAASQALLQRLVDAFTNASAPPVQASTVMLPTVRFDGTDKRASVKHWDAFGQYVVYQRAFGGLRDFDQIKQRFALTLAPPASQWFENQQGIADMDGLKNVFLTQYSQWGNNPIDFEANWNKLALNVLTDDWDSWLTNFRQLADLMRKTDMEQRQKIISLLPPSIRLHCSSCQNLDDLLKWIKMNLGTFKEGQRLQASSHVPLNLTHQFSGLPPNLPIPYSSPPVISPQVNLSENTLDWVKDMVSIFRDLSLTTQNPASGDPRTPRWRQPAQRRDDQNFRSGPPNSNPGSYDARRNNFRNNNGFGRGGRFNNNNGYRNQNRPPNNPSQPFRRSFDNRRPNNGDNRFRPVIRGSNYNNGNSQDSARTRAIMPKGNVQSHGHEYELQCPDCMEGLHDPWQCPISSPILNRVLSEPQGLHAART